MKRTDRMVAPSRGSVARVVAYAQNMGATRIEFVIAYLTKLWELSTLYGFDFAILAAQADNESDTYRSELFQKKGNTVGLARTNTQDLSLVYGSGEDMAYAHIIHIWAYVKGTPLPPELESRKHLDPRYDAVYDADYDGTVKTIADFNVNGRWALLTDQQLREGGSYGDRIIVRGNAIFGNEEQPPVIVPPPANSRTLTDWLNALFGQGTWRITQDWANDPVGQIYDELYQYGAGHGLSGQEHPGIDVGMPYGTKMYAPANATLVCAGTNKGSGAPGGGCGAYNDTGDRAPGTTPVGVGRIELYFPEFKTSLIYGHSRTCVVPVGSQVRAGQLIGTSGGMMGAHIHLEVVRWGTAQGYTYINPRLFFDQLAGAVTIPEKPMDRWAPDIRVVKRITTHSNHHPERSFRLGNNRIIGHDTGNSNVGADAAMHAGFVESGGGSENVSFHASGSVLASGERVIYQMLAFDEVGFHAADGCDEPDQDWGCFQSIAYEMPVNRDADIWENYRLYKDFCTMVILGDDRFEWGRNSGSNFAVERIMSHEEASRRNYLRLGYSEGKDCSHWQRSRDLHPADVREGVANRLAQFRAGGGATPTTPAPTPTTPPPIIVEPPPAKPMIVPGLDYDLGARLFGKIVGEDGVTYKFDQRGPISKLWIARGKATGMWPALTSCLVYRDGPGNAKRRYFVFEDGWTILSPNTDPIRELKG